MYWYVIFRKDTSMARQTERMRQLDELAKGKLLDKIFR